MDNKPTHYLYNVIYQDNVVDDEKRGIWTRIGAAWPHVMPQVPQQRGPPPALYYGLQSRQLLADTGFAEGGRALVIDHAAGKVEEDRRQSCPPWSLYHVLDGAGRRLKSSVR
jgi:hypothetical protein